MKIYIVKNLKGQSSVEYWVWSRPAPTHFTVQRQEDPGACVCMCVSTRFVRHIFLLHFLGAAVWVSFSVFLITSRLWLHLHLGERSDLSCCPLTSWNYQCKHKRRSACADLSYVYFLWDGSHPAIRMWDYENTSHGQHRLVSCCSKTCCWLFVTQSIHWESWPQAQRGEDGTFGSSDLPHRSIAEQQQ